MAENSRGALAQPPDSEPVDSTFVAKTTARLPGYDLVDLIGRGAMGEVWRARQVSLGRAVAVKVLPDKLAQDPDFVARFDKEATALAALSHPNVVQIIDRGVHEGRYFFVMEYVAGLSLRERIRRAPMTVLDALRITRQLCEAIAYAHDHQVVHRDLKPENILIDESGHVKVADFGLAAFRGNDTERNELTATSVAMGTLNYMAPEQRRDAKRVDGRADLYSLGVILYELLTQDLPVGRFRAPGERVAGLDPRIDPVVLQLLESDMESRPKSARDVELALRPVLLQLVSSPGSVPPPSSPPTAAPKNISSVPSIAIQSTRKLLRSLFLGVGALSVGIFLFRNVFGMGLVINGSDFEILRHGNVVVDLDGKHLSPDDADPEAPTQVADKLLRVSGQLTRSGGTQKLVMGFGEGGTEQLHTYAGDWEVHDGALHARQVGDGPGGVLIPRAYVDDRFFSTHDLRAAVTMRVKPLPHPEADDHQFAELAIRYTGLQISVFADLARGMRVSWKYRAADGKWPSGSTDEAVDEGVADEVHVPTDRPFLVELQTDPRPDGTLITASLDGRPFAKRLLVGLKDAPGKLALGCRNLECTFSGLQATSTVPQDVKSLSEHEGED